MRCVKKNALHLQVAKAAKVKTWWLCCSLDVALRKEVTYRSTWTNIAKPLPQPWIVQKKTEGIVLSQPRLPANLPGLTHVDNPKRRLHGGFGNAAVAMLWQVDLSFRIFTAISITSSMKEMWLSWVKVCPPQFLLHWTAIDCATFWTYLGESFRRTKRLVENPLRALDGFMRLNWRAFMVDFLKLSWLLHLQVRSSPKRSNQWMAMVSSVYRQSQVELRKTPTGRCCCLMMSVQFKYLIIYVCLIAFYHSKAVSTWNDVIEPNQHMGGWIFAKDSPTKKPQTQRSPQHRGVLLRQVIPSTQTPSRISLT